MTAEEFQLGVAGESIPARIDEPAGEATRGIVCLPGAGHGPWEDVFDRLAATATERGQALLRYESWPEDRDIAVRSLQQYHAEIDTAVERLRSHGCREITLLGKSFGGGIAATYLPGAVDRGVLWAPSVRVGAASTVEELYTVPFGQADGLELGPDRLSAVDIPVALFQGTADRTVPPECTQAIAEHLPESEYVEIPDGDHSFVGEPFEPDVLDQTLSFAAGDGI